MDDICKFLASDNDYINDEYSYLAKDFGIVIEDIEYNQDGYIDIINIYDRSPASELDLDLNSYPVITKINDVNFVFDTTEEANSSINEINKILLENDSIELEILIYNTDEIVNEKLEKFQYDKDLEVLFQAVPGVMSIEDKSRYTTSIFDIHMAWDNPKLLKELSKHNNQNDSFDCYFEKDNLIKNVLNKIWSPMPDVDFYGSEFNNRLYKKLYINSEDDYPFFLLYESERTVVNQANDIDNFPFDQLNAKFDFAFNTGGSIKLIDDIENDNEYSRENLSKTLYEWDILDIRTDNYFDLVEMNFTLSRKNLYYLIKIMLPIVFIVLISFGVFWIKNQEIEAKLNVSIVSLLALIAYNFVYTSDLPKINNLTILDAFVLIAYLYAGLSTIISIYSYYDYRRDELKGDFNPVDILMRKLAPISYFALTIFVCLLLYKT